MLACVSLLSALSLGAAPGATPGDLSGLVQAFQKATTLRAHFREEKHLSILAVPLVSEGSLFFEAPDRLAREVTAPSLSKMVIEGTHLAFSEGHGVQSIPLDQNPAARMLVDSFLKLLAGDLGALTRLYQLALTGSASGKWTLTLKPKAPPLSDLLQGIVLAGHQTVIERMQIQEKGGDETTTVFSSVELGRPFSADERRRDFGFPAP